MEQKIPTFLSMRGALIMLMTVLMLAFTSAEVRASVMMRVAEETGAGRFYEDKVHRVQGAAVRLSAIRVILEPEALSLLEDRIGLLAAPHPHQTRSRAVASPRAPPHQPRAPPVTA